MSWFTKELCMYSYKYILYYTNNKVKIVRRKENVSAGKKRPLDTDMGLGKSEKGGKWCRGLGAAVGPQWGPGAKPLVGEGFLSMSSQKNSILEHENQIFASQQALCLDQTFTWLFSKLHWKCHSADLFTSQKKFSSPTPQNSSPTPQNSSKLPTTRHHRS